MLASFLFMPLQFIEITLRNKIHSALSAFYNNAAHNPNGYDPEKWLFWMPQSTRIQKKVQEANNAARKNIVDRPLQIGDIISSLSFNVWITVLAEQQNIKSPLHFWVHTSKKIFPYALNRKRSFVTHELNNINTVRNRLFHYEPVWNTRCCKTTTDIMNDIEKIAMKIREVTGWLSPDMNIILEEIGVMNFLSKTLEEFRKNDIYSPMAYSDKRTRE
jgi:hypothetical protein